MDPIYAIKILQLAISAATSIGINIERFQQMRAENGGADLTDEQVDLLLQESSDAVERM